MQYLYSSLLSLQSFCPSQTQVIGMQVSLSQRNWFIGHALSGIEIQITRVKNVMTYSDFKMLNSNQIGC